MVLDFADKIAGYASYGRNRMPSLTYGGEIFELYLAPGISGRRPRPTDVRGGADATSPRTAIRLSSSGRSPATTARSASIAASAGASCGARRSRFGAETRERVAFGFD